MTEQGTVPIPPNLPQDTHLPYFAYGLLKPRELAHWQIQSLLDGEPIETEVTGALYVRDGLPLLEPRCTGDPVPGYLLHFSNSRKAYRKISQFEPGEHYYWDEVRLRDTAETANTLVGHSPEHASILIEHDGWTGRRDPVLTAGLKVVRDAATQWGHEEFMPHKFDWDRLFKLQMAYLFLWTVIERYAALAYGPTLRAVSKVRRLGEDNAFEQALKQVVSNHRRGEEIFDSRNPKESALLDPEDTVSSAFYYYYVRNNITHRGKGAWKDGEIVRQSLLELQEVMSLLLEERIGLGINPRMD